MKCKTYASYAVLCMQILPQSNKSLKPQMMEKNSHKAGDWISNLLKKQRHDHVGGVDGGQWVEL